MGYRLHLRYMKDLKYLLFFVFMMVSMGGLFAQGGKVMNFVIYIDSLTIPAMGAKATSLLKEVGPAKSSLKGLGAGTFDKDLVKSDLLNNRLKVKGLKNPEDGIGQVCHIFGKISGGEKVSVLYQEDTGGPREISGLSNIDVSRDTSSLNGRYVTADGAYVIEFKGSMGKSFELANTRAMVFEVTISDNK